MPGHISRTLGRWLFRCSIGGSFGFLFFSLLGLGGVFARLSAAGVEDGVKLGERILSFLLLLWGQLLISYIGKEQNTYFRVFLQLALLRRVLFRFKIAEPIPAILSHHFPASLKILLRFQLVPSRLPARFGRDERFALYGRLFHERGHWGVLDGCSSWRPVVVSRGGLADNSWAVFFLNVGDVWIAELGGVASRRRSDFQISGNWVSYRFIIGG